MRFLCLTARLLCLILPIVAGETAHADAEKRLSCQLEETETSPIGRLFQGQNGWFFRKVDLRPDVMPGKLFLADMARFQQALASRNIHLIYAAIPPRPLMTGNLPDHIPYDAPHVASSFQQFLSALHQHGIIAPNLLPAVKDRPDLFFKTDFHWNSKGAQAFAQALGQHLKTIPELAAQSIHHYRTQPAGEATMFGTMGETLDRICQETIAPEAYPLYRTEKIISPAQIGEDALFGDNPSGLPAILVGSSFSGQKAFNFDGFLSEYSGLEIANLAITGGEMYNAAIAATASDFFHTTPGSAFIWEAQSIYNVDEEATAAFRQIIPAVYGACDTDQAIAHSTITLNDQETPTILTLPAEKNIHGQSYYLHLKSASPALNRITLSFNYDDGDSEIFMMDRSTRFKHEGTFFVELSEELTASLTSITLQDKNARNVTLTAQLCRAPSQQTNL